MLAAPFAMSGEGGHDRSTALVPPCTAAAASSPLHLKTREWAKLNEPGSPSSIRAYEEVFTWVMVMSP